MTNKKVFGKTTIKVAGTTFENRQGKLLYMKKHMNGAYLTLRKAKHNENDPYAVEVIAHLPETGSHFCAGYIPRNKAFWISKALDDGLVLKTYKPEVVGIYKKTSLGLHFTLFYELPAAKIAPAIEHIPAEEA